MAQLPKDAIELFDNLIPRGLERYPVRVNELDCVYVFKITGEGGGEWTVDCESRPPTCQRGASDKAQCVIEMASSDFQTILTDPSAGMALYFQGKFRVSGDPMQAMKLQKLFEVARP